MLVIVNFLGKEQLVYMASMKLVLRYSEIFLFHYFGPLPQKCAKIDLKKDDNNYRNFQVYAYLGEWGVQS